MKRFLSLVLTLAMALALAVPALAAEVTPTPPAWVTEEEYLRFPGSYDPNLWATIETLRADAAAGNKEPEKGDALYDAWLSGEGTGTPAWFLFELGLTGMKYAENASHHRDASRARRYFDLAKYHYEKEGGQQTDAAYYCITLWYQRARLLECRPGTNQEFSGLRLEEFLAASGYTMEQFKSYPGLSVIPAEEWAALTANTEKERAEAAAEAERAKTRVAVTLDGIGIDTESLAVVKDGRTMIPIRCLAELLGADVSYDSSLKAARIRRAGVEIVMPIGSKTATVNGKPVTMDVAPYIKDGRTMIPARYVSEFFGQSIQWVSETRTAAVTENKALAGNTNLEKWGLAMASYYNFARTGGVQVFGGRYRGTKLSLDVLGISGRQGRYYALPYEEARYQLSDGWGITDRTSLINTITRMTAHGHNDDFLHDAAMIESWSAAEYQEVLRSAQGMDVYMFPYTKQLGQKWGDKGILAWDLFRMSSLVQWGYLAGYVTYPEALALLEPAASLLHDNFKSWDEAYENYLDGYNWWAREDVGGKSTWAVTRGPVAQGMLKRYPEIFNDSLFKQPVVGVPGLTAEGLAASVQ